MHLRAELAPEPHLDFPDVVLVVDVLRATTSATALFERGLDTLILAEELASARALRQPGDILVGEDGGVTPDAFDIGNSPSEILEQNLTGETAVLTTSNGTRAAHLAARSSDKVLLASLNNASAACALALQWARQEVTILCAGRGGRASPDDSYAAGLLASSLIRFGTTPVGSSIDEALTLYREHTAASLFAEVGAYLEPLGLGADIEVCARLDVSSKVPAFQGKRREGLIFREKSGSQGRE